MSIQNDIALAITKIHRKSVTSSLLGADIIQLDFTIENSSEERILLFVWMRETMQVAIVLSQLWHRVCRSGTL